MKSIAAGLAAILSGLLSGALLFALLCVSQVALPPSATQGLGLLWIPGAGLGILLGRWCALRLPRSVALLALFGGLLLALPALPLASSALSTWAAPLDERLGGIAWGPGSLWFWRALFLLAGCLGTIGLARRFGLAALGFGGALLACRSLEPNALLLLGAAGISAGVLASSCLFIQRAMRARESVAVLDLEEHDFGWSADEPPILRPRLAGVMLLSVLFVPVILGTVSCELDGLVTGGRSGEAMVAGAALALALGGLLGRVLLVLSRRMPRAELAPLFSVFGIGLWLNAGALGASRWRLLGERLGTWVDGWSPPLALVFGDLWAGLPGAGPSAVAAGAALVVLPRLLFPQTAEGRRRGQVLIAATLFPLGLLAQPGIRGLAFVSPGPGMLLAALVGLAATTHFLMVDLRGQSVVAVGGRLKSALPALARTGVGLLLGALLISLLRSGSEKSRELFLARLEWLQNRGGEVAAVELGLGGPEAGQLVPWMEEEDWVRGVTRRVEGTVELIDSEKRAAVEAAARRLASLLGVVADPVKVLMRSDPVADAAWILDLGAGGPDQRRALTSASWNALARAADDKTLIVAWLPLDLPTSRFESALDSFGRAVPHATAWMVNGLVLLAGSRQDLDLDLASGTEARRAVAGFIGRLDASLESATGEWRLAVQATQRQAPPRETSRRALLRRRARNLERLAASRTALPPSWGALLGDFPEVKIGRALVEMRLAAAWVRYDEVAAPGSLALESWKKRLDGARLDAALLAPSDTELLAFDAKLRAESDLVAARAALIDSDPRHAASLLLSAREVLGERGDLEVLLAAAFQLSGNLGAAKMTWRALGERGPGILGTDEAWLAGLGFQPPN